ncbi:MAG: hypothetical protein Q8R18_01620 [bacterium]|nr:hypothetical protein [bacterium]
MVRQYDGKGWFRDENFGKGNYTRASAKISNSYFGLGGRDNIYLGLYLEFRTEEGRTTFWDMLDSNDIKQLLIQFHERDVSLLENKIVQILRADSDPLKTVGFLVNKNLI